MNMRSQIHGGILPCVCGTLRMLGLAAQVKLTDSRAAAALHAVAASEAEQRCAALSAALTAAELEAESSVSGGSRLRHGSLRLADMLGRTQYATVLCGVQD